MKLRRKHAWLLTAPLAWLSGCGGGPISGLTDREPVVSLERPDPLIALRNSGLVESAGADAGAFSTAEWHLSSDDPEEQRLFLLSSARRRMQQQQMMMQMMVPMTQPPVHQRAAAPAAPSRTGGTTTKPVSKTAPRTAPAAVAPVMTPQMLMPGSMGLETPPLGGLAARRAARMQRPDVKLDRESNAATVEADRIERAAAAEAERAEKAAQAEASIAESRLLAEAEIVERMTRAETELAERLAAAKEERDRRINLAKEERELRLAIIGVDPSELGTDPVNEALSKLDKTKSSNSNEDSGLTRFTRFFRSKPEGAEAASQAVSQQLASREAEAFPEAAVEDPRRDLIDRTLDHSNELLDRPSIADFAAGIPDVDRSPTESVAAAPTRSGPENLHSSLFGDSVDTDDYDSLLSREAIAQSEAPEREDWSLLNDFPVAGGADREPVEAPAFEFETRDFPAVAEASAASTAPELPLETSSTPAAEASSVASAGRRAPEDDVWILGGERDLAGFDDLAPAGQGVGRDDAADVYSSDAFTSPGGLYAEATPAAADVAAAAEFPLTAAASPAANDPWLNTRAVAVADEPSRAEAPLFDWSQSAGSPTQRVETVVHQQFPSAQESVRNAAWTTQSLRDACGPLPADLEALVLQLDIPEAGVRKDVLADLARLGTKARPALPAIRVLLEDSPLVAAHAAWTLWEIEQNESQAVKELVRLMHTGEPEVVQFTAYALGSLGPKALDAAPALRAERERFTGATRIHVAEALTRIDAFDQASVEVLIASLRHPETHVRWMAAIALGQTQVRYADIAVPALVGALHDQDQEVRAAAALSIGGFGSAASSAVSELQSRATLDSPSVREAAQTALACIRTL